MLFFKMTVLHCMNLVNIVEEYPYFNLVYNYHVIIFRTNYKCRKV